jgi:hypothetical protein
VDIFSIFPKLQSEPAASAESCGQRRLCEIENELHEAEASLTAAGKAVADFAEVRKDLRLSVIGNSTAIQLGAMIQDPERQRVESERDRALQKFHDVLRKRADLMTTLGLIR